MLLHVPESGNPAASEGIQNVPPHSNAYLAAPPDFAQAGFWEYAFTQHWDLQSTKYEPGQCAVTSLATCCDLLCT